MKKPIFFTVRREPYGPGHYVMAVTSQRGSRVWGRTDKDDATNARLGDCRGRFETHEEAKAVIGDIEATIRKHAPIIDAANKAATKARNDRETEIEQIIAKATSRT